MTIKILNVCQQLEKKCDLLEWISLFAFLNSVSRLSTYFWFSVSQEMSSFLLTKYHIRAYSTPLLIKPPLQPNLNKPPLFCLKSPLFKAFWGKNPKNFNKPPPKNPQIFINHRLTIGTDMVSRTTLSLSFKLFFIIELEIYFIQRNI